MVAKVPMRDYFLAYFFLHVTRLNYTQIFRADMINIKYCSKYLIIRNLELCCGGGGIRTPEEFPLAGFQDRCNQPGSATPPNRSIC